MRNETLLVDLGISKTAKAMMPVVAYVNPQLIVLMESGVDDGAYYPASDMSFYGVEQITKLRDLCTLLLDKHASLQPVKDPTDTPRVKNPTAEERDM